MSVVIRLLEIATNPPVLVGSLESATDRAHSVEVVTRWEELEAEVAAWEELAEHALEPNHFYSASCVLAAMRHLQPEGDPHFLIVRARSPEKPVWCGFFPFLRFRSYRGLWVSNLRLLRHDYCFLRTPLVRADCALEVLRAVFEWIDRARVGIVELGDQTGEGAYAEALAPMLRSRGGAWLASSHARALFVRTDDEATFLRRSVSSGKQKELRRQQRRLAERGALSFERLAVEADLDAAIEEFLALERAGWKGPKGTAMVCRPGHRAFFTELARHAARAGRLQLTALRLDGRAIAMKCNFIAVPGAFAFKIAYDEAFAQYSPGVLLELDTIRRMHEEPGVEWMDSCASPGHSMIEHLWKERRLIQSWVLPCNRRGRIAVAALVQLQRLRRALSSRWRALAPHMQRLR